MRSPARKSGRTRLRKTSTPEVRNHQLSTNIRRAMVLEPELKKAIKDAKDPEERKRAKSRYAEILADQGRFLQAAQHTADKEAKKFYQAAAEAVFNGKECRCSPLLDMTGGKPQRRLKYRVIKEIHSMKLGHTAFSRGMQQM
jgi:O6-methylguanine-DNA--protein-cysteine methyltransferase